MMIKSTVTTITERHTVILFKYTRPGKTLTFHTDALMDGYNSGLNACSRGSGCNDNNHTNSASSECPINGIYCYVLGVIFMVSLKNNHVVTLLNRVYQIAEQKNLDPEDILKRIYHCNVYSSEQLELLIDDLPKYVE